MAQVKVMRTPSDHDLSVELVGAGVAGPNGKGGILLSRAAENVTSFQKQDKNGALVLDDEGNPIPLEGKALDTAAKDFVEGRDDLVLSSVSEEKSLTLNEEWGGAPERPPAQQIAEEDYERTFGSDTPDLEAQAEHADEQTPKPPPISTGEEA